jgi:hypothetical protein
MFAGHARTNVAPATATRFEREVPVSMPKVLFSEGVFLLSAALG